MLLIQTMQLGLGWHFCYLHQGGYFITAVCRNMQKLLNRFDWYLESWDWGRTRTQGFWKLIRNKGEILAFKNIFEHCEIGGMSSSSVFSDRALMFHLSLLVSRITQRHFVDRWGLIQGRAHLRIWFFFSTFINIERSWCLL